MSHLAKQLLTPVALLGVLNSQGTLAAFGQQSVHALATGRVQHQGAAAEQKGAQTFKGDGSGTLLAVLSSGKPAGQCPLKHTDVSAKISGYIARVTVKQVFHNPFKDKIEAIYTFPLSETGAVDEMTMKVGQRTIRGNIKKREEARQIYEHAKAAGHVASLLDQERPNIFTQSVANIMPGETVEVTLQYVDLLPYEAGRYTFAFPTIVGPRFIPGNASGKQGTGWAPDTDRVPDASRITPPVTPSGTRAGHDISINVSIDGGVPIEAIQSKLHEVKVEQANAAQATVSLVNKSTIANKDFVLSWDVAGEQLKSGYLAYRPQKDAPGYFTLMILPPKRVSAEHVQPKEMIFLIDCSGSQHGKPLEKAKETLKYIIHHMNPNDTFQIISFNNEATLLFDKPQPVSALMKSRALRYIDALEAHGGTWMAPAVEKACSIPADKNRLRVVTFMTDGYVGNDFEIMGMVKKLRGNSRWFPFGTGNSVNRFLIDGMAKEGGGEAEYVLLNSSGNEVGKKFYDRISSPVLTDVALDFGGLEVKEVFPHAISDVWAERPLYIKGRYYKPGAGTIKISGFSGGKPYQQKLSVVFPEQSTKHDVIAPIWARAKVDRLMSEDWFGAQRGSVNKELKDEIVKVALEHHIMTQYTSFVAVEEKVVTEGKTARTVTVPVEVPDGVSREYVFGQERMLFGHSPGANQYRTRGLIGATNGTIGPRVGFGGGYGTTPAQAYNRYAASVSAAALKAMSVNGPAASTGHGSYLPAATGGDEFIKEEESSSPAERKKEQNSALKLDAALKEVLRQARTIGKDARLGSIQIRDGKINVTLELTDLSNEVIKSLKAKGLEILIQMPGKKCVTGRIAVEQLEELAMLDCVKHIKPAES